MIDHDFTYDKALEKIGDKLGSGSCRSAYADVTDPQVVIKLCGPGEFSNIREYEVWDRFLYYEVVRKWLAPCIRISPCGRALVMGRTSAIRDRELPEKVPSWMTDLKPSNFGMYQGRFVAHDYASHLLLEKGGSRRMMKAVWRNDGGALVR